MNARLGVSKLACALAAVAALAGGVSCESMGPPWRREFKARPLEPAARATPVDRRVFLMDQPRELLEDYTYPQQTTRQLLSWGDRGAEWRIRLARRGHASATLVFRHPYDLSNRREGTLLMFSFAPRHMAKHVSVGLIDWNREPPRVLTDVPLEAGGATTLGSRGYYSIHLAAFSNLGVAVDAAIPGGAGTSHSVDWSDIRELRVSGLGEERPGEEIVIRLLRFRPEKQILR